MPADSDCYFFIDMDEAVPSEEHKVSPLCIPCREKDYPNVGWFWEGSVKGYGPWDFICKNCGAVIHKHKQKKRGNGKTSASR
jgi:hypothetical protein